MSGCEGAGVWAAKHFGRNCRHPWKGVQAQIIRAPIDRRAASGKRSGWWPRD
jgi:hypothetical protein